MFHGLEIIPTLFARLRVDSGIAVLEMHVPDAVSVLLKCPCRIVTASEAIMPGVEAESDEVRIGHLKQSFEFPRCFDKAGAMVVENRPQSSLASNRIRNAIDPSSERLPLLGC